MLQQHHSNEEPNEALRRQRALERNIPKIVAAWQDKADILRGFPESRLVVIKETFPKGPAELWSTNASRTRAYALDKVKELRKLSPLDKAWGVENTNYSEWVLLEAADPEQYGERVF